MNSLNIGNVTDTLQRVDTFLNTPAKTKLLNENLEIVEKTGFRWRLLCLFAPFCRLVGIDLYSHVRVDRVASKILRLCQENAQIFKDRRVLVDLVKEGIIDRLDSMTKGKYRPSLDAVKGKLEQLHPLDIPPNYLNSLAPNPPPPDIAGAADFQKLIVWLNTEAFPKLRSKPAEYHLEFVKMGASKPKVRILTLWQMPKTYDVRAERVFQADIKLPWSVHVKKTPSGIIQSIVLLLKTIVGKGAQTKVRACFDLLSGKPLVRKKLPSDLEEAFFAHFKTVALRGIVPVLGFRRAWEKAQVFEARFHSSLSEALPRNPSLSIKKKWVCDLLYGLRGIHGVQIHGVWIDNWIIRFGSWVISPETEKIQLPPFHLAHCDLKPQNILISETGNEAVIADFGCIAPWKNGFTVSFVSPEKAAFNIGLNRASLWRNKEIAFYTQQGQKSDVWAMGLVISEILKGPKCTVEVLRESSKEKLSISSTLRCIAERVKEKILTRGRGNEYSWFHALSKLTQEEVDLSLKENREGSKSGLTDQSDIETLDHLWDLVGEMLQVDPQKRLTSAQALERFKKLLPV